MSPFSSPASKNVMHWNAHAWFGATIGSMAWLVPLSYLAFLHGETILGVMAFAFILLTVIFSMLIWRNRERIIPHTAYQAYVLVMFVLTTIVFFAIHYRSGAPFHQALSWSEGSWLILAIFPLLSLQLWWVNRSFAKSRED